MKALVIDDHALFTDAILPLLDEMGIDVVGVARTGEEGLAVARRERPYLVLVDLGLPDVEGISVGKGILADLPDTRVLALTGRRDPEMVREAMKAGFRGYLTKDTPLPRFAEGIRAALRGEVVVPTPRPQAEAVTRTPQEKSAALLASQLTPREREVLTLLVEGLDNAQIARRLDVSANTIRTHVQNILTKLGVRSRLQAAAFAVRHEVVDVGGRPV
ncbi:MAG: LuxR C-terminal-related transcriptional regulator [Actinomycetota bacterium]